MESWRSRSIWVRRSHERIYKEYVDHSAPAHTGRPVERIMRSNAPVPRRADSTHPLADFAAFALAEHLAELVDCRVVGLGGQRDRRLPVFGDIFQAHGLTAVEYGPEAGQEDARLVPDLVVALGP